MTHGVLPVDEPGKPLMEVSPDFTDQLMQRIADYQQRGRRRRMAIMVAVTGLVTGFVALYIQHWQRMDDGGRVGVEYTHRGPAPAPKQPSGPQPGVPQSATDHHASVPPRVSHTPHAGPQPGVPQSATNHDGSVPPAVSHTPPATDAVAEAGIRPRDIRITIDGKEITDPAQLKAILQVMENCRDRHVALVRDGKPLNYTYPAAQAGSAPCAQPIPPRK